MDIQNFFSVLDFKITDAIDIIIVAFLLFYLYKWVKGTAAVRIFFGILLLLLLWQLVTLMQLEMLSAVIGEFISLGFLSLIIIFQPEIRKFLFYIGENKLIKWFQGILIKKDDPSDHRQSVEAVVNACLHMSKTLTGALIVFAKKEPLEEIRATGEAIGAHISQDLIENIFYKNSPLHDGAMIIKDEKIAAARCILPVSRDKSIPTHFGLRHRSAIGVTTQSDAIAVLVSEQTGCISFCKEGAIKYDITASELKAILYEEFTNKSNKIKK